MTNLQDDAGEAASYAVQIDSTLHSTIRIRREVEFKGFTFLTEKKEEFRETKVSPRIHECLGIHVLGIFFF